MDPITQGALGAVLPQLVSNKEKLTTTTWLGCLAGVAPDIDVFIRSSSDPLLFLEYHRQFTHSLSFIPVGAMICCLLAYRWSKKNLTLQQSYLVCFLGYATHALLDANTTYGTQLFWPFSDVRIAWNNVSVVDPLVTIPLLVFVVAAYRSGKPLYARIGFTWVLAYLCFGLVQKNRAETIGAELAASRGHQPLSIEAIPGFASVLMWKTIYDYNGRYYVDAIRTGWQSKVYIGDSIQKLDPLRDFSWLDANSQQARDLKRFAWFSSDYLAIAKNNPNAVIDMRYSILPNEIQALWGIRLDPKAAADKAKHVQYFAATDASPQRLQLFWTMLLGH